MFGRLLGNRGNSRTQAGFDLKLTDPISAWGRGWSTQHEATRVAAHWACVRLLADNVARTPLRRWREDADGVKDYLPLPAAIARPGGRWATTYDWLFAAVASMAQHGNLVGVEVGLDRLGFAQALEWLPTSQIHVEERIGQAPVWRRNGVLIDGVVHVPLFPTAEAVWSLSPEQHFRQTFGLASDAEKHAADWYRNGAHPSSIVRVDADSVSDEQAEIVKRRFKAAAKDREPVVMARVLGYEALQKGPKDSGSRDVQEWVVAETARIHNIPVEMVGGKGAGLTYSNREQRTLEFIALALDPYFTRLEAMLSDRLVPRGQRIGFDRDFLLRSDRKTRVDADAVAVKSFQASTNELRARDGKQPVLGGDDPVVSAASLVQRTTAAKNLIASGVDPAVAFAACGLPQMRTTSTEVQP